MIPEDYYEVLNQLAAEDPVYQARLAFWMSQQKNLHAVCEKLSPEDQALLFRYLLASRALESRKAQLAASHYAITQVDIFKSSSL